MQIHSLKLSPSPKSVAISALFVGLAIALYAGLSLPPFNSANSAWKYPFQRPAVGSVTQNIQREIAFHQRLIQQQPTSGLERAALAQTYLKMARATGESSWYLLAQQMAQESLGKLPISNYGAITVMAKVAAAKHDFAQSLSLLKQLPPQAESLALLTTNYLAIGDVVSARQTVDRLVQRMPTLGNLTLKALVEVAQGEDQAALRDFQAAIAAEEPEESGSSAWARTLLGRFYYKRGQLQPAEELYRSALQILPKYPPALLNLAELSVRQWQAEPQQSEYQERAVQLYNQFFLTNQQAPTVYDHVALRGSARLQLLQGNTKQANQTWERAVARLRSDLSGFGHRRELAQLLLERGQQSDGTEALRLMQAEIKIRQDPETWDTLAAAYLQTGQLSAAEQAMQKALKSGIRDPGLIDRAAAIATAQGKLVQAQQYHQQIQSIDPLFDKGSRQALGLGVGLSGLN
jgi:tetratricopeptide (TPR) repeat protein